jgi:hypothetical protein
MAHPLDQSDIWTNRDGLHVQVNTMSGDHALNAYRRMERNVVDIVLWYSIYLMHSLRTPGESTVAFEAMEDYVNREIDRMQSDAIGWLRDKPLMKALLARVPDGHVAGVDTEITEVTLLPVAPSYSLPEFKQAEPAPEIPAIVRKSGDESLIFVVSVGDHEDHEILGVLVGNRRAALQFAAEYDRYHVYNRADVEEWPDHSLTGGGVREYSVPFTEIAYHTEIDLETGEVVGDWCPATTIRQRTPTPISTEKYPIKRHRFQSDRVVIATAGPEHQLMEVKRTHREAVVTTMASILEADKEGDK